MSPEIVLLTNTVVGAGIGACVATAFILTKANAEKSRSDTEKKRADKLEEDLAAAKKHAEEANGKSEVARAVETELRVRLAGAEARAVAQTLTIEVTRAELISARGDIVRVGEKLARAEGVSLAESRRANDTARERDEARHKVETLSADLAKSQSAQETTRESLQAAECLLAALWPLYVMTESALRYQTGEHAYDEKLSERRFARIKLLEAHILYLHEKLKAAESRAAQKEVMKSLLDLAKIILSGHGLPPIPGKG